MKFISFLIVVMLFSMGTLYSQNDTAIKNQDEFAIEDRKDPVEDHYSIYPNPSEGSVQLKILSSDIDQFKLKIYDLHGVLIFDKFFKGVFKGLNLDLKLKNPGLYFLIIESGNHQHVEKIMIKP